MADLRIVAIHVPRASREYRPVYVGTDPYRGVVVIDRHRDRFEFSNPGTLLLSIEQLLDGGISECHNKSLQQMFQSLGAGDKAGSGLDKIRASWHAQHWQSPSLRETLRPDRVILRLPMISMLSEGVVDDLKARFGAKTIANLNRDEIQTLVTAASEGRVTNQRLQEMLTRHRVDITHMLKSLVERDMLEQHGNRRGAFYSIKGQSPDMQGRHHKRGNDASSTQRNTGQSHINYWVIEYS